MDIIEKRERSKNFSEYEKQLLLEIIKDVPIIFSKQRDGDALKKKDAAWASITSKFNEDSGVNKRETMALKHCVTNLTCSAKKEDSNLKRQLFKTGGGSTPANLSSASSTIVSLMPQTFNSLQVDDDDAPAHFGNCYKHTVINKIRVPK